MTATLTVGGGTLPVTFCCLDLGCSSFVDDQFYFVLNTSFVGCPTTSAQINDIFLHVVIYLQFMYEVHHTKTFVTRVYNNFSVLDFFDDFPEFLTCSKASIGTKDGKTEKSSENRLDSSGGKLPKHVLLRLLRPRTFCSVMLKRLSLSSFAFV